LAASFNNTFNGIHCCKRLASVAAPTDAAAFRLAACQSCGSSYAARSCGTLRQTILPSVRLITRRSQVQILPPL